MAVLKAIPGIDLLHASRISRTIQSAFPNGITKSGIILAATLCRDSEIQISKIQALTASLECNLYAAYGSSLTCPVCQRKKKTCSEKETIRLKLLAKQNKNRISHAKPPILTAIKDMPREFTVNDLCNTMSNLKERTIRSTLTLLRKENEFTVKNRVWSKTEIFGSALIWNLLKDPRANTKVNSVESHNKR